MYHLDEKHEMNFFQSQKSFISYVLGIFQTYSDIGNAPTSVETIRCINPFEDFCLGGV